MNLPEEKVLEKLNAVSTAKRVAKMVRCLLETVAAALTIVQELSSSDFGRREEIQQMKRAKQTGRKKPGKSE